MSYLVQLEKEEEKLTFSEKLFRGSIFVFVIVLVIYTIFTFRGNIICFFWQERNKFRYFSTLQQLQKLLLLPQHRGSELKLMIGEIPCACTGPWLVWDKNWLDTDIWNYLRYSKDVKNKYIEVIVRRHVARQHLDPIHFQILSRVSKSGVIDIIPRKGFAHSWNNTKYLKEVGSKISNQMNRFKQEIKKRL